MKKSILFIMVILLSSLVYGVKPSDSFEGTRGLDIKVPTFEYMHLNQDIDFYVHIFNLTDGMPVFESVSCYFHVYNTTGQHIIEAIDVTPSHTFDYELEIGGNNFSHLGEYIILTQCNTSHAGGFNEIEIEVTKNGRLPEQNLTLIMAILGVTALLFILSFKLEKDHFILKLLMILSGFTLIILIPASILNPHLTDSTFYRLTLYIYGAFWIYVFSYFMYKILLHYGVLVTKK